MILALLSAAALTLMVVFDRMMIKDCYENNVIQPLFISSLATSVFGLFLTLIIWLTHEVPMSEFQEVFRFAVAPYGLVILVAGVIGARVLFHYFKCFSENGDSTVVASWLAATPIFVYCVNFLLSKLGLFTDQLPFNFEMLMAVLLTSISLALLESISYEAEEGANVYRVHLFLMMIFNVTYIILIDKTLSFGGEQLQVESATLALSLLPMYWFGFAAGTLYMLRKTERIKLMANWRIVKYAGAIVLVEILGMFVFFFEFLGLGALDSVTVSIIVSLHVIPVWILSMFFMKLGKKMVVQNISEKSFLGIPIRVEALEEFTLNSKTAYIQLILVCVSIFGLVTFLFLAQL